MRDIDLAMAFIEAYCAGNLDHIERVLAQDLRFSGPLVQCHGSADYMAHLRRDPPEEGRYSVNSIGRSGDDLIVEWRYEKPGKSLLLRQRFSTQNGKITAILLRFDPEEC